MAETRAQESKRIAERDAVLKTVQAFFDPATQKSKPVLDAFRAAATRFAPGDSC